MATIVTRAGKGTPLTNNEVDANFTNLNNDKLEVEVNDLTTSVTWDNVPDAYITASSVTQHETALTITESQISDLQNYLTSYTETNDLSTAVTWDNVPDDYITETSVTQHESALTITESQISNLQSYLTSETSHADVLVDGDFSSAGFMKTNGNGGYSVDATTYLSNEIKDEDDMSSNSATALATQQSIKAYVDAHTSPEVNDLTSSVTWANVPDANITESSVTQHQSALTITESQISDLGTYLSNEVKDEDDMASDSATALATQQSIKAYVDSQVSGGGAEVNDLSTTVTWANVPDAYITQSSVTQHQAALSITESQISDLQSYLTTHQDISGKADLSGATFTGNLQIGTFADPEILTSYGQANFYSGANVIGNITATGTIDGRDVANDGTKLDGIVANANPSYHHTTMLFAGYQALSTSQNISVGGTFYLRNYSDLHYKRFLEVQTSIQYVSVSGINNVNHRVSIYAPANSGSAVDIGEIESVTSTGQYTRIFIVAGDVSHWFSDYSGAGGNSNGSSPFSSVKSIYNPSTDKTSIDAGVYQSYIPGVGDSIYVHPYDWETNGTELIGSTMRIDSRNYSGQSELTQHLIKVYLGNIDRVTSCTVKLFENSTGDSAIISRCRVFQVDERA